MGIEEFLLQRAEKKGKLEGKQEGKQEEKVAFIKRLLQNTDFNDEKIALLAGVNVEFVLNLKAVPN